MPRTRNREPQIRFVSLAGNRDRIPLPARAPIPPITAKADIDPKMRERLGIFKESIVMAICVLSFISESVY